MMERMFEKDVISACEELGIGFVPSAIRQAPRAGRAPPRVSPPSVRMIFVFAVSLLALGRDAGGADR
jgi:hypothetical protein